MRRALGAAMVAGALAACAVGSRAPVVSKSAAPPSGGACATCHSAIAEEWAGSLHKQSFTDEMYQASLRLEAPREHDFCNGCHAPARARAGTDVGVDCASCHIGDPHGRRLAITPGVAVGSAACAGCHEFAFDRGRSELVQKTLSEHASSPLANVRCVDCHMPVRAGHPDHRFELAGHSPSAIGKAVHVTASRNAGVLEVAIAVDAGHAFPTGDMFRRVRLLAFGEDARGQIVGEAERVFGRRWGNDEHGGRIETGDTRIHGAWREAIDLEPTAAIVRVRWQLVYERVLAARGERISVSSSDVIAEGEL